MSTTKDWIRYNFQEEFKELEDSYEKKIKKIEEEKEKQLLEQKIQIAGRLLEAGTMSIEEIAKYTDLEESEVKKLAMKKDS